MKIKLTEKQYQKLLNEMRFDGKSTGLFSSEEPQPINEFGEKFKEGWSKFISAAKREGKETAIAAEILKRMVTGKEVSNNEKKFLKNQSIDLLKIVGVVGLGAVSSVIPVALEKMLNKKDISIMPTKQDIPNEDPETGEDLTEGKKKKKKSKKKKSTTLCVRGKNAAKAKYDVYPSAYANGYAVQVCKKKGSKQPQGPWVNICKKKKGGGHPACGRDDSDKGGYPVCRAKSVASNMTQEKKDSACRRKRDKEKNDGKSGKGQSPSPIKVKGYKPKKRKSKKNESVNINRMMITENRTIISEGLRYHLDNQLPLVENIYRYGSESYFNLIDEVRKLHTEGKVDLSYLDEELIKTDVGEKTIFEGKEVRLNFPMEEVILYEAEHNGREVSLNSPKKTGSKNYVYVTGCLKDKSKVKKITYGSAMKDKLKDSDRRKSFAARHGCEGLSLKDKCTKKYWSCRKPRDFGGVTGSNSWW